MKRYVGNCFLLVLIGLSSTFAQRSNSVLVCKRPVFAALKPMPKLSYQCNEQLNDYDEKVLKLPERVAAIESLMTELSSFNEAAWWTADTVDLSVCDFTDAPGMLTRDQRRSFMNGEYAFWLFGNDRIRVVLIPDPCYQTEYGGSNAFLLYRHDGRISVTQVLDGYFSRADNSVTVAFAKLGNEQIIEIATGSGGLTPSLTNYYFTIDHHTNHAIPKNLFRGDKGPTNEISSAMLFNATPAITPLKIIRGQSLAPSFMIYSDSERGRIDDNGRALERKILRWDGKTYR
ncbi:MAG TPA: hypothetical protein VFI24_27120 [Pyrinomonadaceae bacterium]|nr:hypothetical protein [Pyrinomonadaceae bacterium]